VSTGSRRTGSVRWPRCTPLASGSRRRWRRWRRTVQAPWSR